MAHSTCEEVPAPFLAALTSLRVAAASLALEMKEIPAPRATAFSVALTGSLPHHADPETEVADGNFVLLFEPDAAPQSGFRVIVLMRAELDAEMSTDPLLPAVAWTWVIEALDDCIGPVEHLGGSVTRTITTAHGEIEDRPDQVELEIRASWSISSPDDDVGAHLLAWAQILRTSAGQPPLPDGITAIGHRF